MENYGRIREGVKDMIYRELDAIADNGQLSFDCVQVVGELVDILKDFVEIEAEDMAYESEGGYSQRGRMMSGNSYYGNRGRSYADGRSYNGGYSRDGGDKKDVISKLESLWAETKDEHDKKAIEALIEQMKK